MIESENLLKMMAKIFGVEPYKLKNTQRLMAIMQMNMNIVSSLKIKKIQMDASNMPIMYGSDTDDEIAFTPPDIIDIE